jgi:hypothetical protein
LADKKKGIGDALLGLFVVREGGEVEAEGALPDAGAAPPSAKSGAKEGTGDPAVDDLIARYASGDASGKSAAKRAGSRPPSPPSGSVAAVKTNPRAAAESAPPPFTNDAAAAAAAPSAPAVPVPDVKVDFAAVLRKAGLADEEQGRVDKALNLLHTLPAETPNEIKRQIVGASLQAFGIAVDRIIESALLHIAAFEKHSRAGEAETQTVLEQSKRRLDELSREAERIKQTMNETRAHQQGLHFACTRQKMRVNEVLEFFGPEAVERTRQSSVKLRDPKES